MIKASDIRGLEYKQCDGEYGNGGPITHRCTNEVEPGYDYCPRCLDHYGLWVEDQEPDGDCPNDGECYDCQHFMGQGCALAG